MLRQLRRLDWREPVDINEIATRLRVSPVVINNITYQIDTSFPRPIEGRGKTRLWLWGDVLDWYLQHRILRGQSGSHVPEKENRYRNQSRAYRRV